MSKQKQEHWEGKQRAAFHWEDELWHVELMDGLWVDILAQMSHFDHQLYNGLLLDIGPKIDSMLAAMASGGDKMPEATPEIGRQRQKLLAQIDIALLLVNIRAWNLPGRDCEVAPIDLVHLERLDKGLAEPILAAIRKRNPELVPPKDRKGK